MSTPTVERTGDWDSVPFAGGFAGLSDLADDEFSGMVTVGPTRLFMLRGSVIGILDGDIEDFEDADGTAREAPHPALPLLALMQERSAEVRAQYYTEETPISEVDRTLADGNFTGFIELSENVLSGDYYQVYHQGHSMSVAYVGASERLIVDDDAFEQANDEVGIYEVRPVEVDVVEVPEPEDDSEGAEENTTVAGATESSADDGSASGTGPETRSDSASESTSGDPSSDPQPPIEEAEADGSSEGTGADAAANADGPTGAGSESPGASQQSSERGDAGHTGGSEATDVPVAESGERSDHSSRGPREEDAANEPAASGGPSAQSDETVSTSDAATSGGETGEQGRRSSSPGEQGPRPQSNPARQAGSVDPSSGENSTTNSQQTGRSESTSAGPQQGEPAPDHPAAASRGGSNQSAGSTGRANGNTGGSLGAGDLEVRSLPSLDPSRTASASRQKRAQRSGTTSGAGAASASSQDATDPSPEGAAGRSRPRREASQPSEPATPPERTAQQGGDREAGPGGQGPASAGETPADSPTDGEQASTAGPAESAADESAGSTEAATTGETSADLEEARTEVSRLETELAELRDDHDAVAAERDRLEEELAEAREEIDRLRTRLEDATGQVGEASRKLSPREAIDETNLFIRYDSKGEATLEKAHAGEVDKAAVDENMRLEYHTSFDADDASVDGIGFDTFLTDTVQYRFVDWLVRNLLYEIRDTGNTGTMSDLYDALPKADRAELNGEVSVKYTEDGQEHRTQIGFDVIVRDRMGNPLVVANLNDSRDPATESMMTDLVRAAERVGESSPSLAGGVLVTRSFFEPEALETAEEATAGGLLNRGKQKSFVNLSRKGGYHLCLVEARNEEFHLTVPEL